MGDLIDRLANDPNRIKVHSFQAAHVLYAVGEVTAAQIVAHFNLVGDEVTQAALIKGVVDGYATTAAKMDYLRKLDAVLLAIQDKVGVYWTDPSTPDKAAIAAALEIS